MRAPRHYPNIFFSFPFLQCTSICNYIVASNLLLVSPKKPSKKKENERKSPNYGLWCIRI